MGDGRGSTQEAVRRKNLSRVLGHVHRDGRVSRSALTARTGLSRSTIGNMVADLVARGLVEEVLPGSHGTPGRPSPIVQPLERGIVVLAAEIQVDSIACALIGLAGQVHARRSLERRRGRLSPDQIVRDLTEMSREVMTEMDWPNMAGVGVAVVGVVRGEDGFVHLAPNLGWRDVPLAALLRDALGLDVPIRIGNEANVGALAEYVRGAGAGVDDFIYVSGEVGVGAGVIVGGAPLSGVDGYAGEAGHVTVNPFGEPCECGSRGCWETEIGERALLRRVGRSGDEREGVTAVLAEADAGDPSALAALADVGMWLGVGLAGLVNMFNPSRIALGGLFGRLHPHLAEAVQVELDRRTLFPARRVVEVVPAQLGEDAHLIGAAELAFRPVLHDPTIVPLAPPAPTREPEPRGAVV